MRENRSHYDVSAAVGVHAAQCIGNRHSHGLCRRRTFSLWISKKLYVCVYVCVWKCEDVCPLRGAWVTERFIPSACLSKRRCGQGHLRWQWMGCGRGSGIKGLLAGPESGSFSLWQREVTGRQQRRGQADSQPETSAFIQDSGLSVHKKHALSKRPPSTLPHSVFHTHAHTRVYVDTHATHRHTHPSYTVCTHKSVTTVARLPENWECNCVSHLFCCFCCFFKCN